MEDSVFFDSFAVTYILSDACREARVPLVSASVLGLKGYVGVFCGGAPSYRAVFPDMPRAAGSCASAGVLGSAVGVMGTLQAHMVLALLLQWQPSPLARLLSFDFRTLYAGGFSFAAAREPDGDALTFIAPTQVQSDDVVIDLRSLTEAPQSAFPGALRMAVESLETEPPSLPQSQRIVVWRDAGDIVFFGGGTIPSEDAQRLKELGVRAVFTPGAPLQEDGAAPGTWHLAGQRRITGHLRS